MANTIVHRRHHRRPVARRWDGPLHRRWLWWLGRHKGQPLKKGCQEHAAPVGTPKIYTTTGLGPRKNREMAGVDDLVVYMQTAVKYSSLHIHHQIVHTSHFPIFSRPQPGGGVYLWGPELMGFNTNVVQLKWD